VKLGIDFGTTRIVTAAADRGNYPLLTFDPREGNADWFPSLVALRGDERRYGWDAWAGQGEPGWTVVRSLKRILEDAGADTSVEVDGARYPLMELLTGMLEGEARPRPRRPSVISACPPTPALQRF
jgi:molecular chaperone DnaK (HSP70)